MKKYEIVAKNMEFNDIIKSGAYLKNRYYYIYYKVNNLNFSKFGLAISKKCGNAVVRNKLKRQLRMIIDTHKNLFLQNYNYIIVVRRDIIHLSYQEMEQSMLQLLKKGII